MNPSFSAASMEVLKVDIQRILGEKLDQIETNGPEFDAMTDFSQDLVERVMPEASFKLSREQREIFMRMTHQMTRLSSFVQGDTQMGGAWGWEGVLDHVCDILEAVSTKTKKKK